MSTLVSRDPFAREEMHRASLSSDAAKECSFCGVSVWQTPRKRLFKYYTETDGGTQCGIPGAFCSIGCMRSYHG